MKYIRTKDGIYKITNEDLTKYYVENNHYCIDELTHVVISGAYKKTDESIKVADTIEELCDSYVFVGEDKDENGNPKLWSIKQDKPFLMKYYFKQNIIYGAIWTDKGLIYVAKMNEKGELELL